jgi:hypothetical protein
MDKFFLVTLNAEESLKMLNGITLNTISKNKNASFKG